MEDLEKKYNDIKDERDKVITRLQILEKNNIIKEYNNLKASNQDLLRKQKKLYEELKLEEYDNCNHILVNIYNDWECTFKGCIKCGLHDDILCSCGFEDSLMHSYLSNNNNYFNFSESKQLDISCDIELATAICQKIKEVYPNIDDDTLIKYFKNALENIRNNEVSSDRKINRAKRLHLSNNFFNWTQVKSRD